MKFLIFMVATYLLGAQLAYVANWPILYALITLPGTFFHELMHFLTALALQGHPTGFSVLPTWANGRMTTLGHVLFVPNWYNAATVSWAPLILAPLTALCCAIATKTRVLRIPLYLYLGTCAWAACVPSSADFQNALAAPLSIPIAVLVLGTAGFIVYKLIRRVLGY